MCEFSSLHPGDFFDIDLQDSQRRQYGIDPTAISMEEAEHYAAGTNCWTAYRDGKVLAILGVNETFAGRQGVAFALLSRHIGRDHLAITRFARDVVIGESPLIRIEAIVRGPTSWAIDDAPDFLRGAARPAHLLDLALASQTPEMRWATAVGLQPVAVLRAFGAMSETQVLYERVREGVR